VSYARNIVARRLSLRAFSPRSRTPGSSLDRPDSPPDVSPLTKPPRLSAGLTRPHNRASSLSPVAIIRYSDANLRGNQAETRVPSRNVRSVKSLIVQRTRFDMRMRYRLQITEFTRFVNVTLCDRDRRKIAITAAKDCNKRKKKKKERTCVNVLYAISYSE